jgi:nicotinamide-nucleotide amidase
LKPVGLVHIAAAREGRSILHEAHRFGDIGRSEIRMRTIEAALNLLQRMF